MIDISQKREHTKRVRMNDSELKLLEEKVALSGMNSSEFIRYVITNSVVHHRTALHQYRVAIDRIGNNLNQLLRLIHRRPADLNIVEVLVIIAEIQSSLRDLVLTVKGRTQ